VDWVSDAVAGGFSLMPRQGIRFDNSILDNKCILKITNINLIWNQYDIKII